MFEKLSAGTFYRYKAYRVTEKGFNPKPETTPWFETFKSK